ISLPAGNGGTAGGIVHLPGGAALLVPPVQVRFGIGLGRDDLAEVRPHGGGDLPGRPGGDAAGGKIGDQCLAHVLRFSPLHSSMSSYSRVPQPSAAAASMVWMPLRLFTRSMKCSLPGSSEASTRSMQAWSMATGS